MVKGISRRVVVVKAPIGSIFDEAIFIMRDDLSTEIDSEKLLREACFVADEYVRTNCSQKRRLFRKKTLLFALFLFVLALIVVLSTNNCFLN